MCEFVAVGYVVKLLVRDNLPYEELQFIKKVMNVLMEQFDIVCLDEGITYGKRPPFKKYEDVPYVISFYAKLSKYSRYFSKFEYTSYLEGTSGTID